MCFRIHRTACCDSGYMYCVSLRRRFGRIFPTFSHVPVDLGSRGRALFASNARFDSGYMCYDSPPVLLEKFPLFFNVNGCSDPEVDSVLLSRGVKKCAQYKCFVCVISRGNLDFFHEPRVIDSQLSEKSFFSAFDGSQL